MCKSSVYGESVQLLGKNKVDYHQKQVVILSQDSFYRVLTLEQKIKALQGKFNFDHLDAFDNELILRLLKGKRQIPVYDFDSHSWKAEMVTIYPVDMVLLKAFCPFTLKRCETYSR